MLSEQSLLGGQLVLGILFLEACLLGIFRSLLVELHELCEIELRLLQELHLLKEHVVKGEYL